MAKKTSSNVIPETRKPVLTTALLVNIWILIGSVLAIMLTCVTIPFVGGLHTVAVKSLLTGVTIFGYSFISLATTQLFRAERHPAIKVAAVTGWFINLASCLYVIGAMWWWMDYAGWPHLGASEQWLLVALIVPIAWAQIAVNLVPSKGDNWIRAWQILTITCIMDVTLLLLLMIFRDMDLLDSLRPAIWLFFGGGLVGTLLQPVVLQWRANPRKFAVQLLLLCIVATGLYVIYAVSHYFLVTRHEHGASFIVEATGVLPRYDLTHFRVTSNYEWQLWREFYRPEFSLDEVNWGHQTVLIQIVASPQTPKPIGLILDEQVRLLCRGRKECDQGGGARYYMVAIIPDSELSDVQIEQPWQPVLRVLAIPQDQ